VILNSAPVASALSGRPCSLNTGDTEQSSGSFGGVKFSLKLSHWKSSEYKLVVKIKKIVVYFNYIIINLNIIRHSYRAETICSYSAKFIGQTTSRDRSVD